MAPMAPMAPGEGNTKTSPSTRSNAAKRFTFTEFKLMAPEMEELLKDLGNYVIGEEICPSTGKKHLQGYVEFHKKCRPLEVFKNNKAHWEVARGNRDSNIKYCTKDGNYVTNIKFPKPVIDPLKGLTLYKWQEKVLKIIKGNADPRKIHWFWEKKGCTGKTTLAKHLCLNYDALYVAGSNADMKYAISGCLESKKEVDIVILDIPRTKEGFVSYTGMEEIKNGIFFSSKYESGMCLFNVPHFFVFANFAPEKEKLSTDRWDITDISLN